MKLQQKETHKKLLYGLVVYDIDSESSVEKAIDSILKIDYPQDKIKIILSSYLNRDKPKYVNFANIILEKFRHCKLLLNHPAESLQDIDHNSFALCNHSNYLVKMTHDQTIPSDFFHKMNAVAHKHEEKKPIMCYNDIAALPYRLVSREYLKFRDFEKMKEELINQAKNNKVLEIIT